MSICIVISDTVRFAVKGALRGQDGTQKPFDFELTARRLDTDAYQEAIASSSLGDFLRGVVTDWHKVLDDAGEPVPFGASAFERLLRMPGMASHIFKVYSAEVAVKEKN